MNSTNFIRHNDSNLHLQSNISFIEDDQLQVKGTIGEDQNVHNLRVKDNMTPLPDRVDICFNFQASWESDKSLLGSMQECTLSIIQQEETQEFDLSECLKYLHNVHFDNFSAFSPLDDRSAESDDKK